MTKEQNSNTDINLDINANLDINPDTNNIQEPIYYNDYSVLHYFIPILYYNDYIIEE